MLIPSVILAAALSDAEYVYDADHSNPTQESIERGVTGAVNLGTSPLNWTVPSGLDPVEYTQQCIGDATNVPSWGTYFTVLQGSPDCFKTYPIPNFSSTIPARTSRRFFYEGIRYGGKQRFNNTGTVTMENPAIAERIRVWEVVNWVLKSEDTSLPPLGGD